MKLKLALLFGLALAACPLPGGSAAASQKSNGLIVFVRYPFHPSPGSPSSHDIHVLDPRSGGELQLTHSGTASRPAWSPDGRKIAFLEGGGASFSLYVMNADGTNQRALLTSPDSLGRIVWSPDSSKIAFDLSLKQEIYVINADGTSKRKLTGNAGGVEPVWAPDGKKIAFRRESCGLFVMNADGSRVRRVSDRCLSDVAWSPDGQQIAYIGVEDDEYQLFLVEPDGSDRRRIVLPSVPEAWLRPVWSPDSTMLALENTAAVFVVAVDGTSLRQISVGGAGHAVWSPDGMKIAYVSAHEDERGDAVGSELHVVNPDGSGDVVLTRSPDAIWEIDWQRLPEGGLVPEPPSPAEATMPPEQAPGAPAGPPRTGDAGLAAPPRHGQGVPLAALALLTTLPVVGVGVYHRRKRRERPLP